jgi:hypothetical protein
MVLHHKVTKTNRGLLPPYFQYDMERYTLHPENDRIIHHNLKPEMTIQVIMNNDGAYDWTTDVFETFEFRGNRVVVKWLPDTNLMEPRVDFKRIRTVLKHAWNWYRNQVYIPRSCGGAMEDEQYLLQAGSQPDTWLVTDKTNGICIFFEEHKFNTTQRIVEFNRFTDEQIATLPRVLRKIGDWMVLNHREKCF